MTKSNRSGPFETYVFSLGSGRLSHYISDSSQWQASVDLDGDGIPDLIGLREGSLQTLRGAPPEAWRRLRGFQRFQPAADFEGDGVPHLFASARYPDRVSAVSGRDGRLLWSSAVQGQLALDPSKKSPGFVDLDGDGDPDPLLFQVFGGVFIESDSPLQPLRAISGQTGRVLWKIEDLRQRPRDQISHWHLLECRDLDGDREPEVLFAYTLRNNDSGKIQLWFAVVSGKDGRIRWKMPLGTEGTQTQFSPFRPTFLDRKGDGVLDLVVWAITPAGTYEVRALSGQDGALLWRAPLDSRFALVPPLHPLLAISQEKEGGCPLILVGSFPGIANELQVTVLDGLDGKTKRQWKFPERVDTFAPMIVSGTRLDGAGWGAVCATGFDGKTNERFLCLCDSQGIVQGLIPVPNLSQTPIWSADLAGDGKEQLVFISEGKLRAIRGNGQSFWQQDWPVPGGAGEIVAFQPAVVGRRPSLLVVQAGLGVYGLYGGTGQLLWRCDGPGKFAGLVADNDLGPPRVVFHTAASNTGTSNTVCRNALATDRDGRCRTPEGIPREYDPLPEDPKSRHSEFTLSLSQVALGNLLLLFVAVATGLYSWGQGMRCHRRLRRIFCWFTFGVADVLTGLMILMTMAGFVFYLFTGIKESIDSAPGGTLPGPWFLWFLMVAGLVGCLPWKKDSVHHRISRGYYLTVLPGLLGLSALASNWASPPGIVTGSLLGVMAVAVVLPCLLLLWNPRRLRWALLVLVIATTAGWILAVVLLQNVVGRLGVGESAPLMEWASLWFPTAYAVALLAVVARVFRWLRQVLRRTLVQRKPA